MAQTVPSAGFSPLPDYGSYSVADIDFALLQDCEVPSPSNFSALYYDTTSPTMFNSPPHESSILCELKPAYKVSLDDKPYASPPGHFHRPPKKEFKSIKEELEDLEASLNGFMQYHPTPSPIPSPDSPYEPPRGPSIKQEYSEPDAADEQLVLGENQLLREPVLNAEYRVNSSVDNKDTLRRLLTQAPLLKEADRFDGLEDSGFLSSTDFPADVSYADLFDFSKGSSPNIKQEYTMLRKCLGDQSYIQKYNHNPQEVCQLADMAVKQEDDRNSFSSLTPDKIDPVLNMALEQVSAEIDGVCSSLGVSPDPSHWSVDDVKKWLFWASQQYNLQEVNTDFFSFDGATLNSLTENDFRQRAPLAGDLLYACVDLWRTTHQQRSVTAACSDTLNTQETSFSPEDSLLDIGEYIGHWDGTSSQTSEPNVNSPPESSGEPLSEEEEESTSSGRGGSHIHLWQFLKELLSNSQQHSSCIRWVDRQSGVFKIEDSVQVAKLWGKRKNRPAMNYDKLSRSIRQYYKKGIMKKTERSQRLVYQFCHPYSL